MSFWTSVVTGFMGFVCSGRCPPWGLVIAVGTLQLSCSGSGALSCGSVTPDTRGERCQVSETLCRRRVWMLRVCDRGTGGSPLGV